jgi:hypothetical protein
LFLSERVQKSAPFRRRDVEGIAKSTLSEEMSKKRNIRTIVCLASSLFLGSGALADSQNERYQGIVERNVFGLKPVPIQEPVQQPDPPLPKIILRGITTIFGDTDKRVLMKVVFAAARPNEQPTEQSLILAPGQRDGVVEVLEINEKTRTVKLTNSGKTMTLILDETASPSATGSGTSGAGEKPNAPRNPQANANAARRRIPGQNVAGVPNGNGVVVETPPLPMPVPTVSQEQPLLSDQEAILGELEKQANSRLAR